MTEKEARMVRLYLNHVPGWAGVEEHFPKFAEAIAALPDEEPMIYCNVMLQEIFEDTKKRLNIETTIKNRPGE